MIFSSQTSSALKTRWCGIIRQSHMGCKEPLFAIVIQKTGRVVLCVLVGSWCQMRGGLYPSPAVVNELDGNLRADLGNLFCSRGVVEGANAHDSGWASHHGEAPFMCGV
jgi:hypothetical protein